MSRERQTPSVSSILASAPIKIPRGELIPVQIRSRAPKTLFFARIVRSYWRIERGTLSAQRVERVTNLDINPVAYFENVV